MGILRWQKLVAIQLIKIYALDGLSRRILNRACAEHKVGIAMPCGSVLQPPFTSGVGITWAEIVLAGKDKAGVGENTLVLIQQNLRGLFHIGTRKLITTSSSDHKAFQ